PPLPLTLFPYTTLFRSSGWNALSPENGDSEHNERMDYMKKTLSGCLLIITLIIAGCGASVEKAGEERIGYFPNFTHITTIIALENGYFPEAFGEGISIDTMTFPAGSALLDAMSTDAFDIGTVGPAPATNTFLRSPAHEITAGAVNGGAVLATAENAGIESVEDLKGARIA